MMRAKPGAYEDRSYHHEPISATDFFARITKLRGCFKFAVQDHLKDYLGFWGTDAVHLASTGAEDRLRHLLDAEGVGAGPIGFVVKTRTTFTGNTLGLVIGAKVRRPLSHQDLPMLCHYFAEVWLAHA